MSARNSRAAKAARRKHRDRRDREQDGPQVFVTPIGKADLARLGDGYDIFDLMRDNCPVCSGEADGEHQD